MPGDHAGHIFAKPEDLAQCEPKLVIDIPQGTYARRTSRGWVPSKQVLKTVG